MAFAAQIFPEVACGTDTIKTTARTENVSRICVPNDQQTDFYATRENKQNKTGHKTQ